MSLLSSKYHQIEESAVRYGNQNHFRIKTPQGTFEAHGNGMVPIRVHEARAIKLLLLVQDSDLYRASLTKSLSSSTTGLASLILHPVRTISGVPHRVWRARSRAQQRMARERSPAEESLSKELVGFSNIKRKLARQVGVDVYSSNPLLQEELNRTAWVATGSGTSIAELLGGLGLNSSGFAYGSPVLDRLIYEHTPVDLERHNTKALQKSNASDLMTKLFLDNRFYTPSQKTIIAESLANLHSRNGIAHAKNIDAYLEIAMEASSEEEAFFYQRTAELVRGYHTYVEPIREVILVQHIPVFRTASGKYVSPLALDSVAWTPRAEDISAAILEIAEFKSGQKSPVVELWITGRASDAALGNLLVSRIALKELSGRKLLPKHPVYAK